MISLTAQELTTLATAAGLASGLTVVLGVFVIRALVEVPYWVVRFVGRRRTGSVA